MNQEKDHILNMSVAFFSFMMSKEKAYDDEILGQDSDNSSVLVGWQYQEVMIHFHFIWKLIFNEA